MNLSNHGLIQQQLFNFWVDAVVKASNNDSIDSRRSSAHLNTSFALVDTDQLGKTRGNLVDRLLL